MNERTCRRVPPLRPPALSPGLIRISPGLNGDLVREAYLPYSEGKKALPLRRKGKHMIAQCCVHRADLEKISRTTPEGLESYINGYQGILAQHGASSLNIHAANGMSALFPALGQDVAYVAECAQAFVDCRRTGLDTLEISVTLPTLIVGTVGGGTALAGDHKRLRKGAPP
ncbi:hypothetical protein ACQEU3_40205 [Spirillospora sp. CA-253888]